MLDENFWESRYQAEETGWDLKAVSPPLKAIIDSIADKNTRILIPGCGNAHEAEYLVAQNFRQITIIDLATTPIKNLRQKFPNGELTIIQGDFFKHTGEYDLILEQTFFCALNPELRKSYAQKCYDLLKPAGCIRGVLFQVMFEKEGPPFGGTPEEYQEIFANNFIFNQFETCNNSIEKRQGNELLINFQKNN